MGTALGAVIAFTAPRVARTATGHRLLGNAVYVDLLQRKFATAATASQYLAAATADTAIGLGRAAASAPGNVPSPVADLAGAVGGLLAAGWTPSRVEESPIELRPEERLLGHCECDPQVWKAVKPASGAAGVGGLGPIGLVLLLISLTVNVLIAAKRQEDAKAKWRPMDGRSTICLADRRVLRSVGAGDWNDYPHSEIKTVGLSPDGSGVVIALNGQEAVPFQYRMEGPAVWTALLNHLTALSPARPALVQLAGNSEVA